MGLVHTFFIILPVEILLTVLLLSGGGLTQIISNLLIQLIRITSLELLLGRLLLLLPLATGLMRIAIGSALDVLVEVRHGSIVCLQGLQR